MLHNIFLKTVWDYCRQILILGGGLGAMLLFYGSSYNSVFGTGPERVKNIEDYRKTLEPFTILLGKIYDIDTFGGFVNAEIGSMMPILLSLWTLLAGSAIIRGEEERGSLELLTVTPYTKVSIFLQKWAGLMVSLLGIATLSWIGLTLAAIISNSSTSPLDTALAHLNWALLALVFGGFALLFSQLTSRKAAAGWAGGLLAASYLLNNLTQTVDSIQWTRYIYPFYYYNLSQPLARSVGINWLGVGILVLFIAVIVGLALYAYLQRDLNAYFDPLNRQQATSSNSFRKLPEPTSPWLTNTFTFGLRATLPGVVIWGVSLTAYMLFILASYNEIKGSLVDMLNGADFFKQLGFGNLVSNENLLSLFIFLYMVVLVAAHAVVLVASWTAEENEGRLELVLSTPVPRWRFLLTYFGVGVVASALLIGFIGATFGLCIWVFDISVKAGNTVAAFLGLWVVAVLVEATGYVMAAFGPTWAVAVTGGLVVLSFLSDLLQNVLKLPDAIVNLSVFRQYGHPLVEGLHWMQQIIMLTVSIIFIGTAALRFWKRDIVK